MSALPASRRFVVVFLSVCISLIFSVDRASADLPGTQKERTLQSLASTPEGVMGHYFQVDPDTGKFSVSSTSDQNASGTFWQIRFAHPKRDYSRVYSIQCRGNGIHNGDYLALDPDRGDLTLTEDRDDVTTNWRIRYTGKHFGYDAFVVQTVAKTAGGHDMKFLSIDPVTKVPQLTRSLEDASHWFIEVAPDLPTDF